jgi:hypothetical protein
MMDRSHLSVRHWRDRAEEARAEASSMTDLQAQKAMLEVACLYDIFAEKAGEVRQTVTLAMSYSGGG